MSWLKYILCEPYEPEHDKANEIVTDGVAPKLSEAWGLESIAMVSISYYTYILKSSSYLVSQKKFSYMDYYMSFVF